MSNRAVSLGIACPGKLAHTAPNGATECLDAHARDVACRARGFATKFGAGALGCAAGLLHDLGKAKPGFQAYLRGERSSVPHSAEGALFAQRQYARKCPSPFEAPLGRLLAFAIAGHHAGLANGTAFGGGTQPLEERLAQAEEATPWFALGDLPVLEKPPEPLLAAKHDPFGCPVHADAVLGAGRRRFPRDRAVVRTNNRQPHQARLVWAPAGSQGPTGRPHRRALRAAWR